MPRLLRSSRGTLVVASREVGLLLDRRDVAQADHQALLDLHRIDRHRVRSLQVIDGLADLADAPFTRLRFVDRPAAAGGVVTRGGAGAIATGSQSAKIGRA